VRDKFLMWVRTFDDLLAQENLIRFKDCNPGLKKSEIKIMGQLGLLLSVPEMELNATSDLDAVVSGDLDTKELFKTFLLQHNLVLDDGGELIQMPPGTSWLDFFDGKFIRVVIADPLSIIRSKCQFKRLKDKAQINKILNQFPDWRKYILKNGPSLDWLDEK